MNLGKGKGIDEPKSTGTELDTRGEEHLRARQRATDGAAWWSTRGQIFDINSLPPLPEISGGGVDWERARYLRRVASGRKAASYRWRRGGVPAVLFQSVGFSVNV